MEPTTPERAARPATVAEAGERIAAVDKILITCHRGPDGDSVGSMVALASLMRAQDKKVTLYCPDPVPRRLKWLPCTRGFVRALKRGARFPLTIVVDCADAKLLGPQFPGAEVTGEIIALDHHTSACPFGDLYLCDPAASSVGVLVARIARHLGWQIPLDAAIGLYTSLVSDTGSFSYANTNAEALHLAAELVDIGVRPWGVTEKLQERSSLGRYRLLREALGTLELRLGGKVAFMTITHAMVSDAGAMWEDSVELVNYTRAVDKVECGVLFTPAKRGGVRVSMRTKGRVDAGQLCAEFGGGGHVGAAGCVIQGELAEVQTRIAAVLASALGMDPQGADVGIIMLAEPATAADEPALASAAGEAAEAAEAGPGEAAEPGEPGDAG